MRIPSKTLSFAPTTNELLRCTLIFILTFIIPKAKSQPLTIPYRIGDKFGIADLNGRMLIPPQYSWVDIEDTEEQPFLVAFKAQDTGKPRSSLIDRNKVLLRDQPYVSYYRYGQLLKACAYDERQLAGRRPKERFTETDALYTSDGKPVLTGPYRDIFVYTEIDPADKMSEVLVNATDHAGRNSLRIYDKRLKKITRILYDNADLVRVVWNMEEVNPRDSSIQFFYRDVYGKGHRLHIGKGGRKLKVMEDEAADVRQKTERDRGFGSDAVEMPPDAYAQPASIPKESISLDIRSVSIKRSYYYLPPTIEELKIVKERLSQREAYLVMKGEKVGLQVPGQDTLLIPARYDEIMKADFPGRTGGYILRNGNKYGLFIYSWPQRSIIEPVYDYIPLLLTINYSGKGATLIKLYDSSTGRFVCYADGKGKAYYKAK